MNTSDQNLSTETVVQSEAERLYRLGVITPEEATSMTNVETTPNVATGTPEELGLITPPPAPKPLSAKEINDALPFTREAAELLTEGNEGQRIARRLLIDIGETLVGITLGEAENLREIFLSQYGRAKAECAKAKSKGRLIKATIEVEWPKDSVPPFLLHLGEVAELAYKLRKLGAMKAHTRMAIDLMDIRSRWYDRYVKK